MCLTRKLENVPHRIPQQSGHVTRKVGAESGNSRLCSFVRESPQTIRQGASGLRTSRTEPSTFERPAIPEEAPTPLLDEVDGVGGLVSRVGVGGTTVTRLAQKAVKQESQQGADPGEGTTCLLPQDLTRNVGPG